jgi:uncharacterized protein
MKTPFEWDHRKAESNLAKHGVTFVEASSIFLDPLARIFDDEDHSADEIREIIVGRSLAGRLLMVAYAERKGAIRIISARRATRLETSDYEENARR